MLSIVINAKVTIFLCYSNDYTELFKFIVNFYATLLEEIDR